MFYAIGIVLAAFYGGSLAGIFATVLSLPVCDYLFIGPRFTWFRHDTPGDSIMLGLLTGLGCIVSLMLGKWKGARANLQHTIAALEESEIKLRTLTATVPGILFTATAAGECDYLSQIFFDYTGLHNQPPASAWKAALHPEDWNAWSKAIRDRRAFDATCRIRRSSGEYRWFHCECKPMRNSSGEAVKWAGISTDIHDRMILQQALEQRSEELRESSAEFQGFAYRVSHDLREPLRMIGIYTEMMARETRANNNNGSEQPLFIRYILEGVDRIQGQLSQLLDYARSGSQQPHRTLVDVNETLQTVLTNLHPVIAETGAAVECTAMPAIVADPDQIRSVFQNLIGNALKYRGSEPPRIEVSVRQTGDCWEFSIHDNGIGFDMKNAERIFGTFQRLNGDPKVSGSGLGLAIVKRIVEGSGGRIWAESEPGKGSTFHFTMAAATIVQQSPRIPAPGSYSEPPARPRL